MRWGRGVQFDRNGVVVYDGEWLNDDPLNQRIEITSATIVTPLNLSSQVFRSRRPFLSPVLIQQADTLSELLPIAWVVLLSPHFLFGRFRNLLHLFADCVLHPRRSLNHFDSSRALLPSLGFRLIISRHYRLRLLLTLPFSWHPPRSLKGRVGNNPRYP